MSRKRKRVPLRHVPTGELRRQLSALEVHLGQSGNSITLNADYRARINTIVAELRRRDHNPEPIGRGNHQTRQESP